VLPPVPTAGLTAADVGALAARVHDMMVEALREISVPVPPKSSAGASVSQPTPTAPPPQETSVAQDPLAKILPSVTEAGPDISVPLSRSDSRTSASFSEGTSSPTLSRHTFEGSEAGGETEEDEGMVLVGRPRV
jgi:lysophosphatidate acyltransferase